MWIGHTEAVADLYYDVANCDKDQTFIEDHYFDQVCRQPKSEARKQSESDQKPGTSD